MQICKHKFTKVLITLLAFSLMIIFSSGNYYSYSGDPITKYNIAVDFNGNNKTLTGSEIITFTNSYEDSLNEICLHLYPDSYKSKALKPTIGGSIEAALTDDEIGYIKINKVTVNDKLVAFSTNNQLLKLVLEKPLEKNATTKISIDFMVKIPAGTDRLGYKNEVYSITNWYPILSIYNSTTNKWDENPFNPVGESNYSDVSDYNVVIKTPKDIVIVPTGSIISENNDNDIKTSTIVSQKTRDFVFMMSKYYRKLSSSWDGIKINSFYIDRLDTSEAFSIANHLLSAVTDSIGFYSNTYGKYPYPELNIAESYLSGGAMEYPSLIQMGEYVNLDNESMANHSSWLEDAAVHEAGHQWWYVTVGNNEFLEPLMDESLNTFSTAYYFEKKYGKYNANSITMKIRQSINANQLKPLNSSVDKFYNWSEYESVIYDRGPEVFVDLKTQLGEATFIKVMKTYFNQYKFKNGSIKDFANVLEEVSNSNIKAHFLKAITSPTYCPRNISLTAEETRHLKNEEEISNLELRESSTGTNISSILLRGLLGEKLTMVIPSKLSALENKYVTAYTTKIKADLNKIYGIPISVVKDNAITDDQKSGNLIVLGNNDNNVVMKQYKTLLPLKISTKEAVIDNNNIPLKKLSAIYAITNPKNKKNIMLAIYWKDNYKKYNFLEDNYDQYIVNYDRYVVNLGNDIELRGKF